MRYWPGRVSMGLPVLLLAAQLSIAAGGLLANVLSARGLGAEGRGELALYLQITYVVGTVVVLGRDRSFTAVVTDRRDLVAGTNDFARLLRMPSFLALISCTLIPVALNVSGMQHAVLLATALWLVVLGNVVTSGTRAVSIVSDEGRGYAAGIGVSQVILLTIFFILAMMRVADSVIWFFAYGIALLVPFLVVALCRGLGRSTVGRRPRELRKIRKLGLALVPSATAEIITSRLDRLLIPVFAGYAALGYYAVIATFTELIVWPIRHYVDSKVPTWAEQVESGARLRLGRLFCFVAILSLGLSLLVGVMIWFLVPVLFGAEFLNSRELILPLVLGSGVYGISRLGVGVATAHSAGKAVNMINILGMITSVLLYLWLIPSGGALGAAWASFGGYALASVAGAAYLINLGWMSSNGKRVLRVKEPR